MSTEFQNFSRKNSKLVAGFPPGHNIWGVFPLIRLVGKVPSLGATDEGNWYGFAVDFPFRQRDAHGIQG